MNDDNVLPANVVNSSSSRSERTPHSDSIEKPHLEEKLKGRQSSDAWNHFT